MLWYRTSALTDTLIPFTAEEMRRVSNFIFGVLNGNAYYIDDLYARQVGMKHHVDPVEFNREKVKFNLDAEYGDLDEFKPIFGLIGHNGWSLVKTDKGWMVVKIGTSSVTLPRDSTYFSDITKAWGNLAWHIREDERSTNH